jgi:hypothetical protein
MNLYIVTGSVEVTHYMCDDKKSSFDTRPVWADTAEQAEQKWKKYWEDQTDEYSIYYTARVQEVAEALK